MEPSCSAICDGTSHVHLNPGLMVTKHDKGETCDEIPIKTVERYGRYPFSSREYLKRIRTAKLCEDDILIAGYPKTGQTLMEAIVTLILSGGDVSALNANYNFLRTPFIDAYNDETENGLARLQAISTRPRTLRSHLPAELLPLDVEKLRIRTIYTLRSLKDTMVSLYHFCRSYKQLGVYQGDWNDFYDVIMSGDVPYGHAADHYVSWWRHRRDLNVLFVPYEELTCKRACSVRSIARFLNKDLDDAQVDNIVNATSFQSMRVNDKLNLAPLTMAIDQSISPFIRKGIVGDWKNHFTFEQARQFDLQCQKQLNCMRHASFLYHV